MKNIFLGLITTVFLLNVSCNSDKEGIKSDEGVAKFLSLDPKKLGEEHNIVLRKIFNASEMNSKTSNKSAKTAIVQLNTVQIYNSLMEADLGLNDEIKTEIYDYVEVNNEVEVNMDYVINQLQSQSSKNLYLNINNQLTNAVDYNSIITILNTNATIVNNNNFSNFDKQVFNIFIETSKSSAYFWYIENQSTSKNSLNSKSSRATPKWVRKDGNGIAQASIGWAITAAYFGGIAAPATYFAACAVGGALSSIWPD